jgi:ABC-type spermidine/putrescine transport system permease subunit I
LPGVQGCVSRGLLAFTVALGIGVAAVTIVISYPVALAIQSLPRRTRLVTLGLVILPKLANVAVVIYGINLLLGHSGPVNRLLLVLGLIVEPLPLSHSLFGVVIAETYLLMPYAILVLVLTFGRIDPGLLAAARGLGAGSWTAFWRVTWPLSLPGVVVAGELGLIWALGAFVGPVLLGGPDQATLGVMVQKWGNEDGNWPRAAAAAVLSLLTVSLCLLLYARAARPLAKRGAIHA